jgi:hypothetical protein
MFPKVKNISCGVLNCFIVQLLNQQLSNRTIFILQNPSMSSLFFDDINHTPAKQRTRNTL